MRPREFRLMTPDVYSDSAVGAVTAGSALVGAVIVGAGVVVVDAGV